VSEAAAPGGPPSVRVETMLFSLVEPAPGRAVAYNDWYERDHQFAGALSGAGWFSGRRWAAPRRLKALRFPDREPAVSPLDTGSLLSVYWREAGVSEATARWARDQWRRLNADGRIFTERANVLSSTDYWLMSTAAAAGERVPIELALQHPFEGLVAMVVEAPAADRTALVAEIERRAGEGLLAGPAALLSTWALRVAPLSPEERAVTAGAARPAEGLLQLAFLRADPEAAWSEVRAYAAAIEALAGVRVSFAAGFVPTIPGTTAHLDAL
jgi:hypothetical protein